MNEHFSIGEVAILQNIGARPELNGTEVTITSAFGSHLVMSVITRIPHLILGYEVDLRIESLRVVALPEQLKKKRPPATDTGELRIMALFDMPPVVPPLGIPEEATA